MARVFCRLVSHVIRTRLQLIMNGWSSCGALRWRVDGKFKSDIGDEASEDTSWVSTLEPASEVADKVCYPSQIPCRLFHNIII